MLLSIILLSVLLLSGCLPFMSSDTDNDPLIDPTPGREAPSVHIEENYYRGLQPFKASTTRGTLQTYLSGYRLDTERLELGLLEIAQEYFPSDKYLFREGQFIEQRQLVPWLRQQTPENTMGLNPEGRDRILMHILEHNYLSEEGESPGIVLGLSLASSYFEERVNEETGHTSRDMLYYTDDELRTIGAEISDTIAQRLRRNVPEIPIVIALYRLEERNSFVPGNFLSIGKVEPNQLFVSNWKSVNEVFFLFPSSQLASFDQQRGQTNQRDFNELRNKVQDFYPNFVGVVGTGRFIDEELVELTINITTEFASKTEVMQLTQFVGGTAMEIFDENLHLNVYIQAVNDPQAVFVRSANGESMMHIYR